MLDFKLRLLDVHDPKVKKVFKDKSFKSPGFLNLFKSIWSLKINEEEIKKALSLFDKSLAKDEDLILSLTSYFKAFGMKPELWKRVENWAVQQRILKKGGYMNVREEIREEGRWEGRKEGLKKGRQERDREVVLNMLKEKTDIAFISKVTGLSEKEIKKLKKGS